MCERKSVFAFPEVVKNGRSVSGGHQGTWCTPLLLISAIFLPLTCCSESTDSTWLEKRRVELFRPWGKGNPNVPGASYSSDGRGVFEGNSLLEVNDQIVTLAGARYNSWVDGYAGMWMKTIRLSEGHQGPGAADWMQEKNWKGEAVIVNEKVESHRYALMGPRAAVVGDKIFFLSITSNKSKDALSSPSDESNLDVRLYIGTVDKSFVGDASVHWNGPRSLLVTFMKELKKNSWKDFVEGSGKSVVMGDTIFFPLVALTHKQSRSCVIARYRHNDENWTFTRVALDIDDCTNPTLLLWKNELMIVVAHNLKNKVYRSVDMGLTWTDASKTRRYALTNFQHHADDVDRGDILSVRVGETDLLLFAYRMFFSSATAGNRPLLLWMTDNKRTHCLGPISTGHLFTGAFGALLYTREKLYSLHQESFSSLSSLFFTNLTGRLRTMRPVLDTWKTADKRVMGLYGPSAAGTTNFKSAEPSSFDPTTGLVGFWSTASNATHWQDEYLGMDGVLHGPLKRVTTGYTMEGCAAHVVWPVGGESENKVYHLISNGLTVVMSVAVHTAPKVRIPLLGVTVRNGSNWATDVGIWYDNKTWAQMGGDEVGAVLAMEVGKTYQLVFTVKGGVARTYVDGRRVGAERGIIVPQSQSMEVDEMYIGNRDKAMTKCSADALNVTVFNMLLYNYELSPADVRTLLTMKGRSAFETIGMSGDDEEQEAESGGGSMLWTLAVLIPAIVLLFGAAAFFLVRRRRAGTTMPPATVHHNPYFMNATDDTLEVSK
ncbi:unnamed protein product [Trypanosoma congolense IL3000]|uniref:WGS project CAEQ00000000 data, annotated contig 994 n=1 Tax=Trypanosoma congolense (strain IL3000) TaxID=1068625 RepID=F9WK67_TRYCI|nr:unnamed protein product [Trypanosoma congolense IL3000]